LAFDPTFQDFPGTSILLTALQCILSCFFQHPDTNQHKKLWVFKQLFKNNSAKESNYLLNLLFLCSLMKNMDHFSFIIQQEIVFPKDTETSLLKLVFDLLSHIPATDLVNIYTEDTSFYEYFLAHFLIFLDCLEPRLWPELQLALVKEWILTDNKVVLSFLLVTFQHLSKAGKQCFLFFQKSTFY
jgi:hypothetical protein